MRFKRHPFFRHFCKPVQAEHLKSAAVGEDGLVPVHETVQAAQIFNDLMAGTKVQVIGVSEDDLRAAIHEIFRRQCFDRRLRSHRHERRSFYGSVRGRDDAQSGGRMPVLFQDFKFKHGPHAMGL